MPDFGAPVAQNVNVNPVQTLSGILGVRQQQQNLQTGQALQATAQAEASINTRVAQERQSLASIDWTSPQFKNEDGSPNEDAITQAAQRAAPTTGAEFAGRLLQTASTAAKTKSDFFRLNQEYQQPIRDALAVWGANANATPADLHDQLEAVVQNAPKDAQEQLTKFKVDTLKALGIPNVFTGQTKSPQEQHQTALAFSRTALSPEAASGPGGVATPQAAGVNSGTMAYQGSVAPAASANPGAFTAATGTHMQIPPQMLNMPGGLPQPYGGGGAPVPSQYPGPQPTDQDVANFGNYAANLGNRVRAGTNVIAQINQLDQALSSFDNKGSGTKVRAEIAQKLQAIGAPGSVVDAVARGNLGEVQAAQKYLFQSTLDTLQQGGAGVTDQRFASAAAALPSIDTDPRAKASLIGFIRDRAQRDYAEQQALTQARTSGTFNPATWEATYQQKLRGNQVPGTPTSQIPTAAAEPKRSKSKSGKPIVFRNGQWEYE